MDTFLAFAGLALAAIGVIVAAFGVALDHGHRLRTPKPDPEPYNPTSLMIIGVPVNHGRDLPGYRR